MIFFHCLSITSYSLYIICIANTFDEYANGAFMTTAVVAGFFVYVICLSSRKEYFILMECLENVINKSEKISSNLKFYIQKMLNL